MAQVLLLLMSVMLVMIWFDFVFCVFVLWGGVWIECCCDKWRIPILWIVMVSMLGLLDYTPFSFDISHVITIEPKIILKMPLVYSFKLYLNQFKEQVHYQNHPGFRLPSRTLPSWSGIQTMDPSSVRGILRGRGRRLGGMELLLGSKVTPL